MVSPTAKDKGTIRSHSVWRFYLEQFSSDDKMMFACNVETDGNYKIPKKCFCLQRHLFFRTRTF